MMTNIDEQRKKICPNCAQENTDQAQYCIFCGHELPRRSKTKISPVESYPDPVPIVEIVEDLKSKITTVDKFNEEKVSKFIVDEEIVSKNHSKKDIVQSSTKLESKPPQEKEFSKKPDEKEVVSKYDVKKVPETKVIRKRQLELVDIVSFGRLTIFSSIIFVVVLIFITIADPGPAERYPVGMLVFAFLFLVAGIIFDIMRWKNTDLSALGAVIFLIGVGMIFCVPLAYTFYLNIPEFVWFFWIIIAIFFVVGGAGARWSDYDTKIVDMGTMAVAYWQNYEKRAAIRKIFELIGTSLKGLGKSIADGIWHFPRRVWTFSGRIYQGFKLYVLANIGLIWNAVNRFLHTLWSNIHWFGLLAIIGYILNSGYLDSDFYRNTELLIIIIFFFVLGLVTSRSEQVVRVINNTRKIILKGAISAYSMLSGAKIKRHDSLFCSRCLRGVHKIEFAELQHVEDTETPLCPFCGYENWVSVT
ncbi:MAG: zinc ribbon domain-containing protein [Candidatus Hodarchaeales archaeon]|jgi:hypothetical protein